MLNFTIGGGIFSCKIIPIPSHIFHDRSEMTTINGCIINDCSSSTEGSRFCFAPALCEWRKRAKRRTRSLSCHVVGQNEGEVLTDVTNADGCTACDQPPLDRARRCHIPLISTLFLQPFQSLWILPNLNLFTSYKRTNHSHLPTNTLFSNSRC